MRNTWMLRIAAIAALAAASAAAAAQGPGAVRKLAESSLLVKGSITIEPDGRTGSVSIDKSDALTDDIAGFVTQSAQQWKFKPILQDGQPVRAKAPMTVRLVAKRAENDTMTVEIRSASFGAEAPGTTAKATSMSPPRFPDGALRSGVSGTVFLVLRIGRDGTVIDVIPEQTNLRVAASPNEMDRFRRVLEGASVAAGKRWRFTPPATGDAASADSWTVRVPISYNFGNAPSPKQGQWETYIPGPRRPIPWVSGADMLAGGADAVGDGQLQQFGAGPQLLTPLGSG